MSSERVLVLGSGGREHAIAWKLAMDGARVWVGPGNDGIGEDPSVKGLAEVDLTNPASVVEFVRANSVDLVVVGPEAPLCDGIADYLTCAGIRVFGPVRAAAQLEGSKAFSKAIMREAGVKTADYVEFEDLHAALAYVEKAAHPLVIKADGLAAGKGVVISSSVNQSRSTLKSFLEDRKFGEASARVVIEEFLEGPELSYIVITDGESIVPLTTSRDHKRLLDGDEGPNTGGMGAIAPSPDASEELSQSILEDVFKPVLATLKKRGIPYLGFLYAGLMLTKNGVYVLEFNVRLGDPETQAILFGMKSGLLELLDAALDRRLGEVEAPVSSPACVVVLAAEGYPESPKKGARIDGLRSAENAKVFHAGTRKEGEHFYVTGGRVLGVTGRGKSAPEARTAAYALAKEIRWEGVQMRDDIGQTADQE